MPLRKLWLLLLAGSAPIYCLAAVTNSPLQVFSPRASLGAYERRVWVPTAHDSKFATVPHTAAHPSCQASQEPEALATPNPLLNKPAPNARITVSFIIGADGHVHSPLILESAGASQDNAVLNTVRSWKYRPAMCNGVPTEAEGKIEFSRR